MYVYIHIIYIFCVVHNICTHYTYTFITHASIGKWQECAYISRIFAPMEILDLCRSLFLSLLVPLVLPWWSLHEALYMLPLLIQSKSTSAKLQLWHTALHASHHLKDTFKPSTDPKEPSGELPLDKTVWNVSSQSVPFYFIPSKDLYMILNVSILCLQCTG